MTTDDQIKALEEWCDTNLDTNSFEGMRGAKERVEQYIAEHGLDLVVYWYQKPSTGRGIEHRLVIEDPDRVDLVQLSVDQWLRSRRQAA